MRISLLAAAIIAAPSIAFAQASATPTEIADGFFRAIQAGDVQGAYRGIWGDSLMVRKKLEVENLIAQNTVTLGTFGKVSGWELMTEKPISSSFIERIYLVKTEHVPLFYRIQFYKPQPNRWTVYQLYYTDTYKNVQ